MGGGQSSQALVLGERSEAPAVSMRLEKKKPIRLFCTEKKYQVVTLLISLLQERATGGVTHRPSIWGFNCKLSWADVAALQTAEHCWLFTAHIHNQH